MKKYVAICATLAALAWVGVAAADTAQGKLTGSAVDPFGDTLTVTTPILDGGTTYVGLENDKSGNCSGDSGAVTLGGLAATIVCAHFVASSRDGSGPKMRIAFLDPSFPVYDVYRISDNGATDKVGAFGFQFLADAEAVVNEGFHGAGFFPRWAFTTVDGYTITASQT